MTKKMAGYAGWPVTREVTLLQNRQKREVDGLLETDRLDERQQSSIGA